MPVLIKSMQFCFFNSECTVAIEHKQAGSEVDKHGLAAVAPLFPSGSEFHHLNQEFNSWPPFVLQRLGDYQTRSSPSSPSSRTPAELFINRF